MPSGEVTKAVSSRRRRVLTAGVAAVVSCGGVAVGLAPAQAEGFFDSIRGALFGRIQEVRPSYAALPRDPAYDGRRARSHDGGRGYGGYGETFAPRGLRAWSDEPRRGRAERRDRPMTPIREVRLGGPSSGGGRTLCVRLCDGYTFPLGRLGSSQDIGAHQSACSTACPGAQTALYRLTGGATASNPANATATTDGSLYRQLATAFVYRKERVAACSCQGPDNIAMRLPIGQDETLRKGDMVVAANGSAAVYDGKSDGQKTFSDFRDSPALGKTGRSQVDKMLGVSQREATARAFAERMKVASADESGPAVAVTGPTGRTREAALRTIAAPAGSAAGVRAFTAVTPVSGGEGIRAVAPAIYVIR